MRRGIARALSHAWASAAVAALICASAAWATGPSYSFDGGQWADWGVTLSLADGYSGSTPGTHLVLDASQFGGLYTWDDHKQGDQTSSPDSYDYNAAEFCDQEGIFYKTDATAHYLLVVTSTPRNLTTIPGGYQPIWGGDPVINPVSKNWGFSGTVDPNTSDLGIKPGGSGYAALVKADPLWGYGASGTNATKDPARWNGTNNGGYRPGDYGGGQAWWGSNFYSNTGSAVSGVEVTDWIEIVFQGNNGPAKGDDPIVNGDTFQNTTYAYQVKIPFPVLGQGQLLTAYTGPSCLNDGIALNAPGLPAVTLVFAPAVVGAFVRRRRSR